MKLFGGLNRKTYATLESCVADKLILPQREFEQTLSEKLFNCIYRLYYNTHNCMKLTQTPQPLKTLNNAAKTLDFQVKYKTERCRYWEQQQSCPFGEMCAFIHIENEKREKEQIHEHYKTKTCLNFSKYGYCKYGDRCLFLHDETDCSRTRSNSPVSPVPKNKKHGQNLKMLEQFGFCIFEAHMNRQFSKINHSNLFVLEDDCNNTSISTEFSDEEVEDHFNEDFVIERYIINENKKSRMYSL